MSLLQRLRICTIQCENAGLKIAGENVARCANSIIADSHTIETLPVLLQNTKLSTSNKQISPQMTSDHATEYRQWIFDNPQQACPEQVNPSWVVSDPLECTPALYLPEAFWYFITKDGYLPIWGQLGKGSSRFSVKSSNASHLFTFCVAMWAAINDAMRNIVFIALSNSGTVEVFTIDQTTEQNNTTLEFLNANRSVGRTITQQGEDDLFTFVEKHSFDDIVMHLRDLSRLLEGAPDLQERLKSFSQSLLSRFTPPNGAPSNVAYLEKFTHKAAIDPQ